MPTVYHIGPRHRTRKRTGFLRQPHLRINRSGSRPPGDAQKVPLTDRHGAALERQRREGPGAVPPSSGRGSRSFSVAGLAIEQHPVAQAPPHFERFLPSRHAVNLTALAAVTAARALMVGKRAGYQRVRASAPSFRAGVKARALSRPVLLLDVLPQDRDRGTSDRPGEVRPGPQALSPPVVPYEVGEFLPQPAGRHALERVDEPGQRDGGREV